LIASLEESAREMPLTTEKVVSETIILPVLREVRNRNKELIALFSGEILGAKPSKRLNG